MTDTKESKSPVTGRWIKIFLLCLVAVTVIALVVQAWYWLALLGAALFFLILFTNETVYDAKRPYRDSSDIDDDELFHAIK